MNDKMYSIYILECSDGSFYTGMTSNLDARMKSHVEGDEKCARHTKTRKPVKLVFSFNNIKESRIARKGEKYIKGLTREKKIKIINGDIKAIHLLNRQIEY
ncbi:MAG TPA: GIY-YIG nuclease family protein [Draconibacterium sp.]|nr:GIY-YIG nuclease family protein [Draconibacterium sp.]